MNEKIVFVRTENGEDEARGRTAILSNDIKRALLMVDGTASVAEIMKRSSPSLRGMLEGMFLDLAKGGFIQDKDKVARSPKLVSPLAASPKKTANDVDELDFTAAFRVPTQVMLADEAAKVAEKSRAVAEVTGAASLNREADARVKAEQEAAEAKAAERARLEEKTRAQAAEQARLQAERLARDEAARVKANQEAAEAQALARAEAARRARTAAEAARKAAQVDEQARVAAELVKAQVLAQEQLQAEAAREAAVRLKAEQQAAEAQARLEAEALVKAEQVRAEQVRAEQVRAEQVRAEQVRAEQVKAEQVKAEQDRARKESDRQHAVAREEAEHLARQAEAARELASQEAARVKAAEQTERLACELAERVAAEQAKIEIGESARATTSLVDARIEMAEDMPYEAQTDAQRLAAVVRLNAKHAAAEDSIFSALEEEAADAAAETGGPLLSQGDSGKSPVKDSLKVTPLPGGSSVPVAERRTIIATVLFFDIIGYTKQPDKKQLTLKQQFNRLVTGSLDSLDAGERIILDTGDGAAIGFLQHPTDALESAMHFRAALIANKHCDYPDLRVRVGIHLGPVSLVKDMNGQINMLGEGINSAQRVMSFAGPDQIYISRAYFEFVSNLSDEYKDLFRYRGAQQDKHKREHQVYELMGAEADEPVPAQEPSSNLPSFNFEAFNTALSRPNEAASSLLQPPVADSMLMDAAVLNDVNIEPVVREEAVSQEASVIQEEPVHTEDAPQYSDAEARQFVDAQAKKWEEAEQRAAAEAARHKAIPQQASRPAPVVKAAPAAKSAARPNKKPLPWGKLAAGLLVLLVAILFAAPLILPTQGYVASIEQSLSAKLQQPVHIGRLSGRILPTPGLVLSDVYIGEAKQIQVRQAKVNFSVAGLFSPVRSIDSVELDGVQVNGAALRQVAVWLQQTAADHQYPIRRIALSHAQLDADGVQFSNVDGELDFDAAGRFAQARLNADGHKLAVEIHATPEQKFMLSVTLRDSALPLLPNWVFEDMKAVGELTQDELRITELDSRIMGGMLTGDVRINWRSGWRVQGALVAKVIPLQNINKLLSGDLDGSARFQMQAAKLANLADAALLNGVFSVKKGLINGVDVVETTRLHSRESLPGGRTHFDELSGELSYANESYQFRQLRMSDNVVKAFGSLTVKRQELSGNISADLLMRPGAVALQVGGTTESPSLHTAY